MAREARLIVKDACYHIITRGIEKKSVFLDDIDYKKYIKTIRIYKKRFLFKLYGWCLMPNHVHLLICPNNLSQLMHDINLTYAQYFNYKYKRVGYVWQNRFKSRIVNKDKYLTNLLSYVEFNPVRSGIVLNPEDYRWSSYNERVLGSDNFGIINEISI